MRLDAFIGVAGFALGLITAIGGGLVAFLKAKSERERKSYAAERDFNHLKENYKALTSTLIDIEKEMDRNFDELRLMSIEIKALLLGRKNHD